MPIRVGYDPTRRNRNIGTKARGHGKDNRMSIPSVCSVERTWREQISDHQVVEHQIAGRTVKFIIEKTRRNFLHACTPEAICDVLSCLPPEDWTGLDCILLRQPTRKQSLVEPAWGRIVFAANIGKAGKPDVYTGPAILLEATDSSEELIWSRSLRPDFADEFQRLRRDGHKIVEERRGYRFVFDRLAVRRTQLYRTLPHEIGHWVDWVNRVERPADLSGDYGALVDAYWARPERESFAHRYAEAVVNRLPAQDGIRSIQST